jgi:hypothetical protein
MSAIEKLRQLQRGQILTGGDVFDAICDAGADLAKREREAELALEIAIRLLDARQMKQLPPGAEAVVEFLAEECGLYPYVDPTNFSLLSQTLIESHAVDIRDKIYLHSKQMQALLWLLNGDNIILSAPTSFGKSALVDAFIQKKRPHTVVMVLPTIALIDETRRRVARTFGDTYRIISDTLEVHVPEKPTIFVLTQERLLSRQLDCSIDLLFVDEFYKLDPDRDDGRYETLNLALYKYLPVSRQCFMAGPHIRSIDLGTHYMGNFRFIRTDYRTVTVNVIDRSSSTDKYDMFLSDLKSVGAENSLVFTSTPPSAQDLLLSLINSKISYSTEIGAGIESWIRDSYHADWTASKGISSGIAVHHGKLPRSLGQLFVSLFDEKEIKLLICTSTLIEGVNTSAANVFIYDKKIARTDFDFFSFANIRGRVGRMMRHFVGNAYLYHAPPEEIETDVSVPVFSNPDQSSDFLVMNVDPRELSDDGRERVERVKKESGLSKEIIRDHGGIGVDLLVRVRDSIVKTLAQNPDTLLWSQFPDKDQRIALAELALMVAHAKREATGLHTAKQVAWAWSILSQSDKLAKFLDWFVSTFSPEKPSEGVDRAFQFLQACEFSFPRSLAAVQSIVNYVTPQGAAKYGHYISELEQWFRPPWMKQLDESGIPLPLAERLKPYLGQPSSKADALARLRNLDVNRVASIGSVDRYILKLALR